MTSLVTNDGFNSLKNIEGKFFGPFVTPASHLLQFNKE
jgi:hypothetical protein